MAGKSNKGRNRRGSHNPTTCSEQAVSSDTLSKDNVTVSEPPKVDSNGVPDMVESSGPKSELTEHETLNTSSQPKQGEFACVILNDYFYYDDLSLAYPHHLEDCMMISFFKKITSIMV